MLAVFKRELKAYFTSPIGFVFVGLFLALSGIFFAVGNLLPGNPEYAGFQGTITFVFSLFLVPILTMRLLTEETRQHTDQLLITSPLSVTDIVLGKYLSAVAVFLLTLVVTVLYPVIMSFFALLGLEGWKIVGGYVGFFLLGSAFIAVGLFFCSLTDNQIVAAMSTFAALLFIWILDWITGSVPSDWVYGLVFAAVVALALAALIWFSTRAIWAAGLAAALFTAALATSAVLARDFYNGLILKVLEWFSLLKRYSDFSMGILSLSPVIYYLSFSAAFVFLTVRVIDRKRWV